MKEITFVDGSKKPATHRVKSVERLEVLFKEVWDISIVIHIEGGDSIILNDDTIEAIRQEL